MKIDRLMSITIYLLKHGRTSATKLAEHFEVNPRTIIRDIDTLCQAGIPISSTYGVNGGYEILDTYVMDKQLVNHQYLSSIVQGYGYKNVKEFLAEYRASEVEYTDYQSAVARWEQQTGNKVEPDSLKAKLQRKTQEVKERENNRQSHHYRADRGGR